MTAANGPLKLAILYTSHRQFRELDYLPELFARTSRLKLEADILFHCNNGAIAETALREKLSKVPAKSVFIRYAPQQNTSGYPYGQFEAIRDMWNQVDLARWDWIIHLHPDVFIADERPLLAAIEQAERDGKEMLLTKVFGHKSPTFGTDFFVFKPLSKIRPIFDSYLPLMNTPIVVPLEMLLFIEVHRAAANYAIGQRHLHGHYHRDIDGLGVWHEHNLDRLEAYLRKPSSRWWYTAKHCLFRPRLAIRAPIIWLGRKYRHLPQDSLAAQLSSIEPKA